MIFHYLKIAFRNLCKHKTQNIISIIGLALLLCLHILQSLCRKYRPLFY